MQKNALSRRIPKNKQHTIFQKDITIKKVHFHKYGEKSQPRQIVLEDLLKKTPYKERMLQKTPHFEIKKKMFETKIQELYIYKILYLRNDF